MTTFSDSEVESLVDPTAASIAEALRHDVLDPQSMYDQVVKIAKTVVAAHADSVDADARFPRESIDALRSIGALSCMIPVAQGGSGLTIVETAAITECLGQYCSSTAMVFAMHQIQVASLIRHGRNATLRAFTREVAEHQLLLASATTETGIGGDVRSSLCFVERDGDRFHLEKDAPVISYGAYADAILVTARRNEQSPANDQVLVVCRREATVLTPTTVWDTLGFRGTCSPGHLLKSDGPIEMILDDPYSDVSSATMLPTSHVVWGSVWLGIANAAVAQARKYVQKAARQKPGTMPPGAVRLAELVGIQLQFSELVHGSARRYELAMNDIDQLSNMRFAIDMNTLKISSSTLVVDVVGKAMLITGISGYRLDSPFSLGRLLRDAYGAALMVNNDRIAANTAQLVLIAKE